MSGLANYRIGMSKWEENSGTAAEQSYRTTSLLHRTTPNTRQGRQSEERFRSLQSQFQFILVVLNHWSRITACQRGVDLPPSKVETREEKDIDLCYVSNFPMFLFSILYYVIVLYSQYFFRDIFSSYASIYRKWQNWLLLLNMRNSLKIFFHF